MTIAVDGDRMWLPHEMIIAIRCTWNILTTQHVIAIQKAATTALQDPRFRADPRQFIDKETHALVHNYGSYLECDSTLAHFVLVVLRAWIAL